MRNDNFMADTLANEKFINLVKDRYLSKTNIPMNLCTRTGVRTFNIDIPILEVHERFKVMYPTKKDDHNNIKDDKGQIFNYSLVLEHGIDEHAHYIFVDKLGAMYDYPGNVINEICLANEMDKTDKPYHLQLNEKYMI